MRQTHFNLILIILMLALTGCLGGSPGGGGSDAPAQDVVNNDSDDNDDSDDDTPAQSTEKYSVTLTLPSNGIYSHNQSMTFVMITPNSVSFTGTPRIKFTIGNNTAYANYSSSTDGKNHNFVLTVNIQNKDDIDEDGISWENTVDLNGGTIRFDSNENVGEIELDKTTAANIFTHAGTFLAWYDASAKNTISDSGEAYANEGGFSNTVSSWEDKSKHSSMVLSSQGGDATYSSTGLNSKPSVDFSGTNSFEASASIFSSNTDFTIIAVAFADSTTGNRQILGEKNTQEVLFGTDDGDFKVSNLGRSVASTNAISGESVPFILTSITDATETNLYVNDSSSLMSSTTALTSDASMNKLRVGRQYGAGEFWDGDISEILIFDEALSETQKDAVVNYLKTKWDI